MIGLSLFFGFSPFHPSKNKKGSIGVGRPGTRIRQPEGSPMLPNIAGTWNTKKAHIL